MHQVSMKVRQYNHEKEPSESQISFAHIKNLPSQPSNLLPTAVKYLFVSVSGNAVKVLQFSKLLPLLPRVVSCSSCWLHRYNAPHNYRRY